MTKDEAIESYKFLERFKTDQMPFEDKVMGEEFLSLAIKMAMKTPINGETLTGLSRLLDARNCFIRASHS